MPVKNLLRKVVPANVRSLVLRSIPRIKYINTYVLRRNGIIENLTEIDKKFVIRKINLEDADKLKKAYSFRSEKYFLRNGLPRLNNQSWQGLAVIDSDTNDIAYVSWVILKNVDFIDDLKIKLGKNQFFVRDGYCVPTYRHQGLHTRMEQERINFCVRNGANSIFVLIENKNEKGKISVIENGFKLFQQNIYLVIPAFGVYHEFFTALKYPFKSLVKRIKSLGNVTKD